MTFEELKKRKEKLFIEIVTDKYNGKHTSQSIVAEYRFLQREEKRRNKMYFNRMRVKISGQCIGIVEGRNINEQTKKYCTNWH